MHTSEESTLTIRVLSSLCQVALSPSSWDGFILYKYLNMHWVREIWWGGKERRRRGKRETTSQMSSITTGKWGPAWTDPASDS